MSAYDFVTWLAAIACPLLAYRIGVLRGRRKTWRLIQDMASRDRARRDEGNQST